MTTQSLYPAPADLFSNIQALSDTKNHAFRAFDTRLNQQVLLKFFPMPSSSSINQKYHNEKSHLESLSHPNIVQLLNAVDLPSARLDSSLPEQSSYLVLELAALGDLLDIVSNRQGMSERMARTVFRQVIEGISYLHSKNIAHLDVKLENLVMTEDYTVKITDFDLSQPLDSKTLLGRGTMGYRAPEIKEGLCQDLRAADVYSAGVILFILLAGHNPYVESNQGLARDKWYKALRKNTKAFWGMHCMHAGNPELFSDDFKDMVEKLLAEDPMARPTIEEIKEMNWYKGETLEGEFYVEEMKKYMNKH